MSGEDRFESALGLWCERTMAGEALDPAEFARAHGLPEAEFAARVANARWLVARHVQNRAADEPQIPRPPFMLADAGIVIEQEVGRGAMGIVFRGHREADHHQVAVKLLAPHIAGEPRARERLRREAAAALRLRHPNAVAMLAVGEHAGFPFLVMEWVEGEPLARLVERRGAERLGCTTAYARETAWLFARIARALQQAHELGLLHRDVKPANLLIDTQGTPFLADFGLVRDLAAETLTDSGALVGSLAYLAPELLVPGGRATPQSDVYALGVSLYECLTLRRPFTADSDGELRLRIREGRLAPLMALDAGVPPPLDRVCRKACACEPRTRYPSAAAFAADLEAFARGEPVAARAPSPALRLQRFVRRHRRAVVAGAVLVAGVGLAALGTNLYASVHAASRRNMREQLWNAEASGDMRRLARGLAAAEREFPGDDELRLKLAIGLLQRGGPADLAQRARRLLAAPLEEPGLEPLRALVAAAVELAVGAGQALTVERACEEILGQETLADGAALLAGRTLLAMGWIQQAERMFARVGPRDPRLATLAAEGLADCRYRSGSYEQALAACAAFATVYDTPARRFLVVRYAQGARMEDRARAAAEELAHRHPDSAYNDAASLLLGGQQSSTAVLESAQQRPDWAQAQPAIERLLIGSYLRERQFERAVELLERFVSESPRDPNLRAVLGRAMLEVGRRDEGLAQYHKAALDGDRLPFERDVHWGTYHFFAGDYAKAVEHFRAAVRICPNDTMRLRPLAGSLCALAGAADHPAARISCWREIVAVHEQEIRCAPEDRQARFLLGEALASLAKLLEATDDPEAAAVRARREAILSPAPLRR